MAPHENKVDVLIIGAGPAGLMAATWMSRLGIKTRIVDKRGTKVFNGQADGLQCRTLEILDSFGFAHRVWRESNHMLEICFWNPDESGVIRRTDRIPDTKPGISRFTEVVLHQGRIERFFLDSIKEHSDIVVERGVLPIDLSFDDSKAADHTDYPVSVTLRHLSEDEAAPAQGNNHTVGEEVPSDGLYRSILAPDDTDDLIFKTRHNNAGSESQEEIVKARYLIGCDGAHSWTRRQLGWQMEGEQTDYIWGVLDIIPITNFPDIRMRCAIHSAASGSVMVIPRENKLVRLYIQLTETSPSGGGKFDRSNITPAVILTAAQKIIAPYELTYKYCDWWTAYQIGQRVGSQFSHHERIFLAGDAVHTHSPKAGQGMNVSMQDTYNLGWKIGGVANGTLRESVLKTYQSERRRIAQDLIAFDHKFSRLFSGHPAKDAADEAGISMEEFKRVFEAGGMFASGLSVDYGGSEIVAKGGEQEGVGGGDGTAVERAKVTDNQELAAGVKLGMRFPSAQVVNQADARPWQFQEWFVSDGRWRIVVFAGNLASTEQAAKVQRLGQHLAAPENFLQRSAKGGKYSGKPKEGPLEILLLHSAKRMQVELLDLHDVYHPFTEREGWDYNKVFVDDNSHHEGFGDAYTKYGVKRESGCLVVARPDQYVSWIGEVDDWEGLKGFFDGVLKCSDTA